MSRVLDETYSQIKKVENQIGFELEGTREALEKLELDLEDWPSRTAREYAAFEIARQGFWMRHMTRFSGISWWPQGY